MTGIRKMADRWWIQVCPGCNGMVSGNGWGGTEAHNETCPYRGKMFKPRDVEVIPADSVRLASLRLGQGTRAEHGRKI